MGSYHGTSECILLRLVSSFGWNSGVERPNANLMMIALVTHIVVAEEDVSDSHGTGGWI